MEFKPATIVKGQGICKLMAKSQENEENDCKNETELHMIDVCPIFTTLESWYRYLIHYLQQGHFPEDWNSKQRRELCLKFTSYQIIDGVLLKKNYDRVFLRCLE